MAEAVFFVVERSPNGERPALYYDILPRRLTGKNAQRDGLIYQVRVDVLPNSAKWLAMSLGKLYEAYQIARARGKLPPLYQPPSMASSEPAQRKIGHREIQRRAGSELPAEPWPTVEDLDRRAANRRPLIPRIAGDGTA